SGTASGRVEGESPQGQKSGRAQDYWSRVRHDRQRLPLRDAGPLAFLGGPRAAIVGLLRHRRRGRHCGGRTTCLVVDSPVQILSSFARSNPQSPKGERAMDKAMDKEPELIRQQMEATRAALTYKVEMLEKQVMADVEGATTAVEETVAQFQVAAHETVQSLKLSVQDAVEAVRNTLDLRQQVNKRPWEMGVGATALGFLGGYVFHHSDNGTVEKAFPTSQLGNGLEPELAELKGLVVGALLGALRDMATEAVPKSIERQMGDIFNGITVKLAGRVIRG